MSEKPLKILVAGDVEGNYDKLFSRISSIQKKSGNFDLLLCVGDFFSSDKSQWEPYQTGKVKVPVTTLILGPNNPEHVPFYSGKDGELCDNVTYLGKRGTFTGSSGLSISYLSGLESSDDKPSDTHFTENDVHHLTFPAVNDSQFRGVDILITSQWPKSVQKYATSSQKPIEECPGSEAISQLALRLRPRYHFSALNNIFYERQPYRNHKVLAEKERHVTRFIGMAKVANTQKMKYLYAFSIAPLSGLREEDLTKQPQEVTECPFTVTSIRNMAQEQEKGSQFFYDMKSGEKGKKRQREDRGDRRQHKKQPQPTGPCWFCLASPEVEKHLVVSVGTQTYLALAKGGLVPDHILILPIGHHQSTVLAPSEVREEIEQYKAALKKCFKQEDKAVVFFERNYKTQHLQIQAVPVPADCVQEMKDSFMDCAESESLELNEIPKHSDLKQIVPPGVPYFYAELPTGDKLLHRISKHFPLQFGRDVLTSPQLLNMPERVDWKNCKISKGEETDNAKSFRASFGPFDFNL